MRYWDVVESIDVEQDPGRLAEGVWILVAEFDGSTRAWRFAHSERASGAGPQAGEYGVWSGPSGREWTSSLNREQYVSAVEAVRSAIYEGEVYQANICRVLSAPAEDEPSAPGLDRVLAIGNPAPYGGYIQVPPNLVSPDSGAPIDPVWIVSASPELYLRRDGALLTSSPIKGTAVAAEGLTGKDEAENVMITDLVRNDLQRVCEPGSIAVVDLLKTQAHPGLVHLVSTVQGRLRAEVASDPLLWQQLLQATFPPGSVSGAPKESALRIIAALESVPRGPYCGAIGWVDAGSGTAELAVGIRTFWWERDETRRGWLRFGTGAGITWGSDPGGEWEETELKARRLIALASSDGSTPDCAVAERHP